MQNLLGRMALALETEMNTQHRLGVDLQGNVGGDFFVPSANAAGRAGLRPIPATPRFTPR